MAPLQDHALSQGEEFPGTRPQLTLDAHSVGVVPHVGAESGDPLVLVQPDGWDLGCQAMGTCRLPRCFPRCWKPTGQHEASLGTSNVVDTPVCCHDERLRDSGAGIPGPLNGHGSVRTCEDVVSQVRRRPDQAAA